MGRFMYVHFGDDVPRNIEREYNKLLRREQYLIERDAENGMIDIVDFNDILEIHPDPASLPINYYEEEQQRQRENRLQYLPTALDMLKKEFPEGYELIMDYYLGEKKITIMYLMEKYSLTRSVVKYRLKLAKQKLKEYIILHENE